MDVRPEIRADAAAIAEVHRLAFADPSRGYEGEDEVRMVEELRRGPTYLPALSLVAVEGGKVVGHILFTLVTFLPDEPGLGDVQVLSLAPLGVLPRVQGQGVGARLVNTGIRRASVRPEPFVVVLGSPAYYGRFGFTPASAHGIRCPFPDAPEAAYQVRRLPGYRPVGGPGTIRYYSAE
jgi:putative acetyltransferase